MTHHSLEDKLREAGDPVTPTRNSQIGPYVYPTVPAEFSNWRDEQVAWRETCALFDQSHHMTDLQIEGPRRAAPALRPRRQLVRELPGRQGQAVRRLQPRGLRHRRRDPLPPRRAGVPARGPPVGTQLGPVPRRDPTTTSSSSATSARRFNPAGRRKLYRFQVHGPTALEVLGEAAETAVPEVRFFNMGEISIAGHRVRALHHGMSGAPGLELFGPWEEAEHVRAAIVEAGRDLGLRQVGARVYATNTLESGWIPSPLPAVFTGEELKPYRAWLPAEGYEGTGSLGGSFASGDIADHYLTPHDLGYWSFVKFDHDFIGREALERLGDEPPRRKVTLAWNGDDIAHAMGTLFQKGDPIKYIDLPLSNYATWPYDKVLLDGEVVGLSTFSGYSYNERSMLSLAIVDADVPIGAEVTLVWGEEGESAKPVVERHVQAEFHAIVSPCPYSEVVRASYGGESRRTRAKIG